MSFDQGEFDFSASNSEEGFHKWREELDERKRGFERRFGVILGRLVRVSLAHHRMPIEGIIRLASEQQNTGAKHLRFHLREIEFSVHDIESIVGLDPQVD